MHLLAVLPGGPVAEGVAVDLGQTPGDLVVLSAADSELACLSAAQDRLGQGAPSLRLANLLELGHPLSIDLYLEKVAARARLIAVRLLGGERYWPYGVEQLVALCQRHAIALALLPGDDQPDPELTRQSTVPAASVHRLWQYLVHGGLDNAIGFLGHAAALIGRPTEWAEPAPLLRAGLYWPLRSNPSLAEIEADWQAGAPVAGLVFYRALVQAANLEAVDAVITALVKQGLNPLPIAVTSLKEAMPAALVADLFARTLPAVILNATSFALSQPGQRRIETPFDQADCPVLQVVFSGGGEAAWRSGTAGLSARDLAMNVALPEVDGRLITPAVSFKAAGAVHPGTQCRITGYRPVPDRIDQVAALAAGWARLRRTPAPARRLAIVLANYPNRDGRLANGVGLDTPAGVVEVLAALRGAGYRVEGAPADPATLMAVLSAGPTNAVADLDRREGGESLSLGSYRTFFARLPGPVQERVITRWGKPDDDPFLRDGGFRLAMHRFGNIVVAIQPARGYGVDPVRSYHDPDLPPPHHYLAFYAWLRTQFAADAVIHFGKHGNLEWLPGKALALSAECFPEVALGPLPHLYPFIVNDPGEGTQAKRRAAAVVIDHLTPPLTRAESYGPLRELELLVDEYYQAAGLDPRRLPVLREKILELTQATGLDRDLAIDRNADPATALTRLDNHLCELKELQIRDGLHVFGVSPRGDQLIDLLVALARLPRGGGTGRDASLTRALAADLGLSFDPLNPVGAERIEINCPWPQISEPERAGALEDGVPRTQRHAVDRLEAIARALVAGTAAPEPGWARTRAVLDYIASELRPVVAACGEAEIAGLLRGLDGRFVQPGPSGAPTRGRPEVLPTGRNFYSVDTRSIPTPTAWTLGWKSACLVIERYLQEHGDWPRAIALSAWGTANMRTGGDDIAQAMALMGVQPAWDPATGRVTGFEIMPPGVLDRPRVDVTFRVSGFFRDAFPAQIDLVDAAARAVARLDEPEAINPLAARFRRDRAALLQSGATPAEADRRAGFRVFGSKPGAYGAGLQALIDERGWHSADDLAEAYLVWGGYAYGAGAEGAPERGLFEARLAGVEAVLHNQDNREHDLLDSDDYYQFEGGLTAAVRKLSGQTPVVYHNDHSRPETPQIRTLEEEIARTVRGRVVNPKWIAGVMRHGYKGAFEIAATVDYLFAFAATTGAVKDHHFDAVFDAFLGDDQVRDFIATANPAALTEIADRLLEAQQRGLWRPRSNRAYDRLNGWAGKGPALT